MNLYQRIRSHLLRRSFNSFESERQACEFVNTHRGSGKSDDDLFQMFLAQIGGDNEPTREPANDPPPAPEMERRQKKTNPNARFASVLTNSVYGNESEIHCPIINYGGI